MRQISCIIGAVWWMAPFFSGGGYSSEAVAFAVALSNSPAIGTGNLWISQHGDGFLKGVMQVCRCIEIQHPDIHEQTDIPASCHTCQLTFQKLVARLIFLARQLAG